MSYAGFDDQYGLIPTNPSYFNLPDLPNSTPKGPSHLEVIEPSGVAVKDTSGLNVTHVADLPKSVPPVSSNLRVTDHFGMQSSMPNQLPGQPSTYPALSGSLQTQYPDPAQHTSASSLLHQNQPNQTPVRGKAATGKRRRSPQSILGQRIPATRKQNSKPKGVPETFLSTICLNPPPKRPRTVSEKQDKRDVLKAGGACLLCRLFKKKVYLFGALGLCQTKSYSLL